MDFAEILLERMADIDVSPNELVHRYYQVLTDRGIKTTVMARRNMVRKILDKGTKPDITTFQDLVAALGGKFYVKWG